MIPDNGVQTAVALLEYLDNHKNDPDKLIFIGHLNELTVNVLVDSFGTALHTLLHQNGWDDDSNSFADAELNVETLASSLCLYVKRREKRDSSLRSSQVDMKNRIKSFAPDMLMTYSLEKQFDQERTKIEPFSVFFDGVCLLADISGFTRLSGKFCQAGKDGIDQLQEVVNGYLGQLVKIIYAYGGDVMKFAGDALVCIFQPSRYLVYGKELTVADACSNAVQCATELAQIFTAELTIHVAVSCGPICFAVLGGYDNIWECLVSGQCLGHLSQCLEDAGSKQTVVSPQLIEKIGVHYLKELNIEQLSSGNYRVISAVKINSLLVRRRIKRRGEILMKDSELRFAMFPNNGPFIAAIGLFVPMPVSVGLSAGTFDYLAELREVTTMFMSWDSYNEEVHSDLLSLQNIFLVAQKILIQSGGFIRQFLIDDKGCILIACWGVPTASHPDNARRALCAGAIIGYELNELGMQTSVGITTGNVFCGSVGSHVRREYAVIGDVVNLAARLMSKAKGGLYVDEATFSRIPLFLQQYLQKIAPMAVKGKDQLVAAYSLKTSMPRISLNDKGDGESNTEILSVRSYCKLPLEKSMERISRNLSSQLDCILLEGKVGTGKKEAVDWLKLTGLRKNIRVVHYCASPKDCHTSYDLLAKLFRLLLKEAIFDDKQSQDIALQNIFRSLYKDNEETIQKVAYPTAKIALGIKSEINTKLPKSVLHQCLDDVFRYLLHLSRVVVVVENINSADNLSMEILINLIGMSCCGLLVMTTEPLEDVRSQLYLENNSDDLSNLHDERKTEESSSDDFLIFSKLCMTYKKIVRSSCTLLIQMNDYSVLDVDQLLCDILKLEVCPDGLSLSVHQLSGGDPFWCRELAQFIELLGAHEFANAMTSCRHLQCIDEGVGRDVDVDGDCGNCSGSGSGSGKGDGGFIAQANRFFRHDLPSMNDYENHDYHAETVTKLQQLVVCRLETLSREDQNILRTASIIGRKFTLETLYGVLSPKMRTQMFFSINSLVENHWIAESLTFGSPSTTSSFSSSSSSSRPYPFQSSTSLSPPTSSLSSSCRSQNEVETVEYSFVHPLFYQTLYELTPASDKARLHYSIAKYIEESYGGNPTYYARLGLHYGVAKDCRSKALEYYSKAANHSLSDNIVSFDQSLNFLNKAKNYADTAMDYGTILGILTTGVQELYSRRKILIECKEPFSSAKTFLSWDTFRSQTYLLRIRKNRINIAPPTGRNNSSKKNHNFTIENINILLDLFYDMEDKINLSYDGMVLLNCVGIIYAWQMSYLKKWKTFSFEDSNSPQLESFLTKNSTRSLSLSQGKIKLKKTNI